MSIGLFNFLDPLFGLVLTPLLGLPVFFSIAIMTFFISLVITLVYKFFTNQSLMKQLREEINSLQKEMKELKDNPDKALHVQTKAMETNFKYMMESFRPTLITFIPIIIIFAWMSSHLAYQPIMPGENFAIDALFDSKASGQADISAPDGLVVDGDKAATIVNGKAGWTLEGNKGSYSVDITYQGKLYSKDVIVTSDNAYASPVKAKHSITDYIYSSGEGYLPSDGSILQIKVGNRPVRPLGELSIFGWHPGWLATYLILTIIFSQVFRKLMKVY